MRNFDFDKTFFCTQNYLLTPTHTVLGQYSKFLQLFLRLCNNWDREGQSGIATF